MTTDELLDRLERAVRVDRKYDESAEVVPGNFIDGVVISMLAEFGRLVRVDSPRLSYRWPDPFSRLRSAAEDIVRTMEEDGCVNEDDVAYGRLKAALDGAR